MNDSEIAGEQEARARSEELVRACLMHVQQTFDEIEIARIHIAETYSRIAKSQELLARSERLRRALSRELVP